MCQAENLIGRFDHAVRGHRRLHGDTAGGAEVLRDGVSILPDKRREGVGMETIVIEDTYGRYRVTIEAESDRFVQALRHDLAEPVVDLMSLTVMGTLVQSDGWPEHFMKFLRRYMRDMRDAVKTGGVH